MLWYVLRYNRQLQDKFVTLLRLLLLWDPKTRGGAVLDNGRRECFDVLENTISTVVILYRKSCFNPTLTVTATVLCHSLIQLIRVC